MILRRIIFNFYCLTMKGLRKYYTLSITLLPVIMCYKIPVVNYSVSTVLVALLMIPATMFVFSNLSKPDRKSLKIVLPFFLYVSYVMFKSDSINIMLQIAIIIHFLAITNGIIRTDLLKKYLLNVSIAASLITIVQLFTHYLLGGHIPCIYFPGIMDSMKEQYFSAIYSGVGRWGGMYRPCSFFLEPAHMAQYSFIGLLISLFDTSINKKKKKYIITIGIIATSSGIGILSCALCWGLWAFITKVKGTILEKIVELVKYSFIGGVVFVILLQIPYFQNALTRMTVQETGEYNAVDGRLFFWDRYIGEAHTDDLMFGFGSEALPDVFFTGMMTVIYAYGYIGAFLFYSSLTLLILCMKNTVSRLIVLIYLCLTFSSDVVGFIWIIYLLGVSLALNYKYSYEK